MSERPRSLLIFSRSKRQRMNVSGYFNVGPLGISTLAASLGEALPDMDSPVKGTTRGFFVTSKRTASSTWDCPPVTFPLNMQSLSRTK